MKTDADTNRIQDGVISMLARMVMMEYVMLASTNNLGIRYAYTLSSDEIAPYMQELEETDEVAFRARLALTRYLPGDDLQTYYAIISRIMSSRIATTDGLQDVASIFGQHMPAESAALIQSLIADGPMDEQIFNTLTEAQQQVLLRYIQLVQLAQTNPESATQQLSALITQSISSQSQIATFVLR
jgi:histidinol phosphatase-like enzyme